MHCVGGCFLYPHLVPILQFSADVVQIGILILRQGRLYIDFAIVLGINAENQCF